MVVGILIAISLNNANQSRIERADLDEKVIKMRTEVYQDSLLFVSVIDYNSHIISKIDVLSSKLSDKLDYDNYKEVQQLFNDVELNYRLFVPKANTYNELISSGDFSRIQDEELKEKISFLYSFYDHYTNVTYQHVEVLLSFNQTIYGDGIISSRYIKSDITKKGFEYFNEMLENPSKRVIFENYIHREIDFRKKVIRRYETMLQLMTGLPVVLESTDSLES